MRRRGFLSAVLVAFLVCLPLHSATRFGPSSIGETDRIWKKERVRACWFRSAKHVRERSPIYWDLVDRVDPPRRSIATAS